MTALQILVDGFAISALYGVGAVGFTLIFGVSGVLNLSHGALMVVAAVVAWYTAASFNAGPFGGAALGIIAGLIYALATFVLIVRPIQRSRAIQNEEKEIFVLTGTLLWGLMTQQAISYLFTNNPRTVLPLVEGVVDVIGVRTPVNEIITALISWAVIGLLYIFVQRTRTGKVLLAASMNARGVTLLGFELSRIYLVTWAIYGLLAGLAGVLLGAFLGVSSDSIGQLTASAFSIVVLGGLGSVSGSLIAAYVVGYIETITAYTVAPSVRTLPVLALLVLVVYMRPQGLLGRR
ncbi:MAG TPA: branched-chain amino acid ABC transporter permease [Acetobacteraceae bacterium]|nr:branched-chain amino acid ABC transporter permease [Acetobacteraceae bacterium]